MKCKVLVLPLTIILHCRSQGPAFKMSEPPRREQIALALAEKVGEKNRDQKKKNIDAQRRQLVS